MLSPPAALAHDTWFALAPDANPPALQIGTGDRFPRMESRLEPEHLLRHGCAPQAALASRGPAAAKPLLPYGGPAGRAPGVLNLRIPSALAAGEPVTCWASLVTFEIQIEPAKVETYLREISASPSLRAAWAAEQAAGRPWRERYVKHVRAEFHGAAATPVGLALEALLLSPARPQRGQEARFQLLHNGQPLADQPVEWVNERSPVGLWRRTDAQGQVSLPLPLEGRWLMRSVLLRPPLKPGEPWTSDFATLAFDVLRPTP